MSSNWQTLNNVFTFIRDLSGKDSTTLPDTSLLPIANKYYFWLVRELVGLNEDLYAEISYTDLVLAQREYPLPIDDTATTYGGGLIKLLRVEVTYDGSNWYIADPMSLQEIPTTTILDADLNAYYEKTEPKYWFKDRSVWIAPAPESGDALAANNNGLYIYWIKRPNEVSGTDVPDLPKDWLMVLSEGILSDVYRKFGRTIESRDSLQNFYVGIARMKELEQNIDQEQQYILKTISKDYS